MLSFWCLVLAVLPFLNASPINRQVGISENVFMTTQNGTDGLEQRVCSIDAVTYMDGETIPTSSPCEHCVCRPPGFACTITSCEYRPGCKAFRRSDQCCPEYQCECEKDGKIYQNGEKIMDNNNPCEVCYCQGGEIICAVIDCYWRNDCPPRYIDNRCCPMYDHCPPPAAQGPIRHRLPSLTSPITLFNLTQLSSTTETPSPSSSEAAPEASSTTISTTAPVPSTESSSSVQPNENSILSDLTVNELGSQPEIQALHDSISEVSTAAVPETTPLSLNDDQVTEKPSDNEVEPDIQATPTLPEKPVVSPTEVGSTTLIVPAALELAVIKPTGVQTTEIVGDATVIYNDITASSEAPPTTTKETNDVDLHNDEPLTTINEIGGESKLGIADETDRETTERLADVVANDLSEDPGYLNDHVKPDLLSSEPVTQSALEDSTAARTEESIAVNDAATSLPVNQDIQNDDVSATTVSNEREIIRDDLVRNDLYEASTQSDLGTNDDAVTATAGPNLRDGPYNDALNQNAPVQETTPGAILDDDIQNDNSESLSSLSEVNPTSSNLILDDASSATDSSIANDKPISGTETLNDDVTQRTFNNDATVSTVGLHDDSNYVPATESINPSNDEATEKVSIKDDETIQGATEAVNFFHDTGAAGGVAAVQDDATEAPDIFDDETGSGNNAVNQDATESVQAFNDVPTEKIYVRLEESDDVEVPTNAPSLHDEGVTESSVKVVRDEVVTEESDQVIQVQDDDGSEGSGHVAYDEPATESSNLLLQFQDEAATEGSNQVIRVEPVTENGNQLAQDDALEGSGQLVQDAAVSDTNNQVLNDDAVTDKTSDLVHAEPDLIHDEAVTDKGNELVHDEAVTDRSSDWIGNQAVTDKYIGSARDEAVTDRNSYLIQDEPVTDRESTLIHDEAAAERNNDEDQEDETMTENSNHLVYDEVVTQRSQFLHDAAVTEAVQPLQDAAVTEAVQPLHDEATESLLADEAITSSPPKNSEAIAQDASVTEVHFQQEPLKIQENEVFDIIPNDEVAFVQPEISNLVREEHVHQQNPVVKQDEELVIGTRDAADNDTLEIMNLSTINADTTQKPQTFQDEEVIQNDAIPEESVPQQATQSTSLALNDENLETSTAFYKEALVADEPTERTNENELYNDEPTERLFRNGLLDIFQDHLGEPHEHEKPAATTSASLSNAVVEEEILNDEPTERLFRDGLLDIVRDHHGEPHEHKEPTPTTTASLTNAVVEEEILNDDPTERLFRDGLLDTVRDHLGEPHEHEEPVASTTASLSNAAVEEEIFNDEPTERLFRDGLLDIFRDHNGEPHEHEETAATTPTSLSDAVVEEEVLNDKPTERLFRDGLLDIVRDHLGEPHEHEESAATTTASISNAVVEEEILNDEPTERLFRDGLLDIVRDHHGEPHEHEEPAATTTASISNAIVEEEILNDEPTERLFRDGLLDIVRDHLGEPHEHEESAATTTASISNAVVEEEILNDGPTERLFRDGLLDIFRDHNGEPHEHEEPAATTSTSLPNAVLEEEIFNDEPTERLFRDTLRNIVRDHFGEPHMHAEPEVTTTASQLKDAVDEIIVNKDEPAPTNAYADEALPTTEYASGIYYRNKVQKVAEAFAHNNLVQPHDSGELPLHKFRLDLDTFRTSYESLESDSLQQNNEISSVKTAIKNFPVALDDETVPVSQTTLRPTEELSILADGNEQTTQTYSRLRTGMDVESSTQTPIFDTVQEDNVTEQNEVDGSGRSDDVVEATEIISSADDEPAATTVATSNSYSFRMDILNSLEETESIVSDNQESITQLPHTGEQLNDSPSPTTQGPVSAEKLNDSPSPTTQGPVSAEQLNDSPSPTTQGPASAEQLNDSPSPTTQGPASAEQLNDSPSPTESNQFLHDEPTTLAFQNDQNDDASTESIARFRLDLDLQEISSVELNDDSAPKVQSDYVEVSTQSSSRFAQEYRDETATEGGNLIQNDEIATVRSIQSNDEPATSSPQFNDQAATEATVQDDTVQNEVQDEASANGEFATSSAPSQSELKLNDVSVTNEPLAHHEYVKNDQSVTVPSYDEVDTASPLRDTISRRTESSVQNELIQDEEAIYSQNNDEPVTGGSARSGLDELILDEVVNSTPSNVVFADEAVSTVQPAERLRTESVSLGEQQTETSQILHDDQAEEMEDDVTLTTQSSVESQNNQSSSLDQVKGKNEEVILPETGLPKIQPISPDLGRNSPHQLRFDMRIPTEDSSWLSRAVNQFRRLAGFSNQDKPGESVRIRENARRFLFF